MTAPEPTAVERTIAEVLTVHHDVSTVEGWAECSCRPASLLPAEFRTHATQAVVAAIRNLPPEQMAQLSPAIAKAWDEGYRRGSRDIADETPNPYRREVTGPATSARDLTPGARDDL